MREYEEVAAEETVGLDVLLKLDRAVKQSAASLTRETATALVKIYYGWQEHRIALMNQFRTARDSGRTDAELLDHFVTQTSGLEKQMVAVLGEWAANRAEGKWAQNQKGIGPVLSAAFCAHIDITKAPTVGHIWRFAGLDPTVEWGKGQKRPWNAELKVVCWRAGDSFVKVSGRDGAYYGHLYKQRKEQEVSRNEQGLFKDQAAASLEKRKIKDAQLKKTYEEGKLPPGRLDLRARRYAVKLFLAHFHEVAYEAEYGRRPPLPYPIAHLGHAHVLERPA